MVAKMHDNPPPAPLVKYWLEAGVILFFEKQPDKPHIPRRGEYFTSQAIYKAEDVAREIIPFIERVANSEAESSLCNEAQRLLAQLGGKEE